MSSQMFPRGGSAKKFTLGNFLSLLNPKATLRRCRKPKRPLTKEEAERKKARKNWKWKLFKYDQYNSPIAFATFLTVLVLYGGVLGKSITFPGLVFCDDDSCPAVDPGSTDLPVAIVVLLLYSILYLSSFLLIMCPGVLMDFPLRNKILAILSIFLMTWSTLLVISPLAYRYQVYPYWQAQEYDIVVTRKSADTAQITFQNVMDNQYPNGQRTMFRVYKIPNDESNPRDLNPTVVPVWSDNDWDDTEDLEDMKNRSIEVDDLDHKTWYFFVVHPARRGHSDETGNPYPVDFPYDWHKNLVLKNGGGTKHDVYLDMTLWKKCKWNRDGGCETGNSDGCKHCV